MQLCPTVAKVCLVQLSRYRTSKWAQKRTFCNILQHVDDGLSLVGDVVQSLPHGVWEIQQKVQVQRVLLGLTQPKPEALFLLKPQIHSHWLWLDKHRVSRCGAQGGVPLNSWGWGLRLKDLAFGSLNLPNASGTCPLKGLATRKIVFLFKVDLHHQVCYVERGPPQLSNLWWMLNSVSKSFDTAMRTGSSRRFKRHPTT